MSELKSDYEKQEKSVGRSGLKDLAQCAFAGFLVWCTFNYPMSDNMRVGFFIWAVLCSL